MGEMINDAVETTEVVAETVAETAANNHAFLKEAGKYGIAAAAGAGLTILGEKLVKKGKEKRLAKKAKKEAKKESKEVSKVDQLCKEIEESLKN